MARLSTRRDAHDDVDGDVAGSGSPGMPLWVKAFAVIGLLLVVLLIVGLLVGANHGPGRHFGSSVSESALANTAVGHERPAGADAR